MEWNTSLWLCQPLSKWTTDVNSEEIVYPQVQQNVNSVGYNAATMQMFQVPRVKATFQIAFLLSIVARVED